MPDRDNWSSAMVLRWVLTRDQAAVTAMVKIYGAVRVEDGTLSHLVPDDMEAVLIAYCIDPTLPPGEERDAAAVVRSEQVIAARHELDLALRRGDLEARARRNGSGDVETITPQQWLALKLQSSNGHDIAVPVNVESVALDLPRRFEDYICGRVSSDIQPAVWPDPLFAAEQVRKIWPPFQQTNNPQDGEFREGSDEPRQSREQATSGAQSKCERWLRKIGPDELVKMCKPYWRSKAIVEFSGLSGRGFDRAWGNVAADFPRISQAGAKPKK